MINTYKEDLKNRIGVLLDFFKTVMDVLKRPKVKKKCIYLFLTVFIYISLMLITEFWLSDVRMFTYALQVRYWYTWVVSLVLLIFFDQYFVSLANTIGNALGIVTGQVIGDWIVYLNSYKIYSDMDAEEYYWLTYHYGGSIYIKTVLIFLIVSSVVQIIRYYKNKENNRFKRIHL